MSQTPTNAIGVSKWTGTGWQVLGAPLMSPSSFDGLEAFDDGNGPKLVAFGRFTQIGSTPCDRVARWTGSTWAPFGPIPNFGYVRSLCTYNDGTGNALYVGGDGTATGGNSCPVLKWSGQAWTPITAPPWRGLNGSGTQVSAMHVFDDGRGPALYVAGYFASAAGVPANGLARWDGHAWEAVPGGVGFQTYQMVTFNDVRGPSLFLAGTFNTAGGGNSPSIAQWVGCPNCYNNCDASAAAPVLNINDFMCFINAYARKDPYANCNLDTAINVADFQCFMAKFATGCM